MYANQLAGISDIELFDRHGEPVEEKSFDSLEAALDTIIEKWEQKRKDYETEVLVLFTEKEAEHAFLYLEDRLKTRDSDGEYQLTYMNRDSQNFKKGLTVTTFYLAKGLEFDQVFGVFGAKENSGLALQARYITATRALHELHMYEVEEQI